MIFFTPIVSWWAHNPPEEVDVLLRLYRPVLEQTFEPPEGPERPTATGYCLPPLITTDPVSAEMIKLVTEWPQYRELDLARLAAKMHTLVLVDGRNLFDPKEAGKAGWTYMGVER